MNFPIEQVRTIYDILSKFTETSNESTKFTSVKVEQIEKLGAGMKEPIKRKQILTEIANFEEGLVARRQVLSDKLEHASQEMMQSIEFIGDDPVFTTPQERQACKEWLSTLEIMRPFCVQAKEQFESLSKTYNNSPNFQADLTQANKKARIELNRFVGSITRLGLYADNQIKIARRWLEQA